jgi:hypothetical protein
VDPAAEAAIRAGNNGLTDDDRRVPQNAVGDVADDAWQQHLACREPGSPLLRLTCRAIDGPAPPSLALKR